MHPGAVQTFVGANAMAQKQTQHNYPAIQAILSCLYEGGIVNFDTAIKIESKYFLKLLADPVDIVLLDNMSTEELRQAVAMVDGAMITEASGGITPDTARALAETGVDVLSVGWITHSAPNLDVALDF